MRRSSHLLLGTREIAPRKQFEDGIVDGKIHKSTESDECSMFTELTVPTDF